MRWRRKIAIGFKLSKNTIMWPQMDNHLYFKCWENMIVELRKDLKFCEGQNFNGLLYFKTPFSVSFHQVFQAVLHVRCVAPVDQFLADFSRLSFHHKGSVFYQ